MNARLSFVETSFGDVTHVVGPARVSEDLVVFLDNCVEKVCDSFREVADALCASINFVKFHCSLGELCQVDGGCFFVVRCKREDESV